MDEKNKNDNFIANGEAIDSLRKDINRIDIGAYRDSVHDIKQNRGLKPRDNYGYSSDYTKSVPTTRAHKRKPTKRVVNNQNIVFENVKKIKDIILRVIVAGTLVGAVGMIAKFNDKTEDAEFDNIPIEQEYTQEDAVELASALATNEMLNTEQVRFIQNVNNGEYQEPLITDQYSTKNIDASHVEEYKEVPKEEIKHVRTFGVQDGYTPLSEDPTYKDHSEMSR